jgi:hypothetical protein
MVIHCILSFQRWQEPSGSERPGKIPEAFSK